MFANGPGVCFRFPRLLLLDPHQPSPAHGGRRLMTRKVLGEAEWPGRRRFASVCARTAPNPHATTNGRVASEHGFTEKTTTPDERVRAKGDLSRRRTIIQNDEPTAVGDSATAMPAKSTPQLPAWTCLARAWPDQRRRDDGPPPTPAAPVRRLLRTLTTDERNIVGRRPRSGSAPPDPVQNASRYRVVDETEDTFSTSRAGWR